MKKNKFLSFLKYPLFLLFMGCLFASCQDTPSVTDQWRAQNEQAFATYEKNKEYTKVTIDGFGPHVMMKWLKRGEGKEYPIETSRVKIHYEVSLLTGSNVIDGNYNQEAPTFFSINRGGKAFVITGLRIALQNMVIGDEAEIAIPWYLAYGERELMGIRAYSALLYKVRLDDIVPEEEP